MILLCTTTVCSTSLAVIIKTTFCTVVHDNTETGDGCAKICQIVHMISWHHERAGHRRAGDVGRTHCCVGDTENFIKNSVTFAGIYPSVYVKFPTGLKPKGS